MAGRDVGRVANGTSAPVRDGLVDPGADDGWPGGDLFPAGLATLTGGVMQKIREHLPPALLVATLMVAAFLLGYAS